MASMGMSLYEITVRVQLFADTYEDAVGQLATRLCPRGAGPDKNEVEILKLDVEHRSATHGRPRR